MKYKNGMRYIPETIFPEDKLHKLEEMYLYNNVDCRFQQLCASKYRIYGLGDVYVSEDILDRKNVTLSTFMDDVTKYAIDDDVISAYSVSDYEYLYGVMEGAIDIPEYMRNKVSLSYLEGLIKDTKYEIKNNKLLSIELGYETFAYIEDLFEAYERLLMSLYLYLFWALRSVVSGTVMLCQDCKYGACKDYFEDLSNIFFLFRNGNFKAYQVGLDRLHRTDKRIYRYIDGQEHIIPKDILCNRL